MTFLDNEGTPAFTFVLLNAEDDGLKHLRAIIGVNGATGIGTLCGEEPGVLNNGAEDRQACQACMTALEHYRVIRGEPV